MTSARRVTAPRFLTACLGLVLCLSGSEGRIPVTPAEVVNTQPTLVPLWQEKLGEEIIDTYLTGDTLILAHGRTLEARDAHSGARLWSWGADYFDENEEPASWASSGDAVSVAYTTTYDETEDETERVTVHTFDARTGTHLWNLRSDLAAEINYFDLLGTSADLAFLFLPNRGEVRALDANTGVLRWRSAPLRGCDTDAAGSGERLLVLLVTCGERPPALWALDPSTGRVHWTHTPRTGNPEEVTVWDDVIKVGDDTSFTLLDTGGHELYRRTGVEGEDVMVGAGVLGVVRVNGTGFTDESEIELIDWRTGRLKAVYPSANMVVGAERLYFDSPLDGGPRASILYAVDRAGDTPQVIGPLPLAGTPLHLGSGLFVLDLSLNVDKSTLAVYAIRHVPGLTPGEAARGGVPAASWPDACALLPQVVNGVRYAGTAHAIPVVLGLRRPVRCHAEPVGRDGPTIGLDVLWVFPDGDQAGRLLSTLVESRSLRRVPDLADQAFVDTGVRDAITFRVGPAVLQVFAEGEPALARRLVGDVSRTLGGGRR
ncbi:outer membrane protein assembly factor BamB family protein [Streptosporangium sp. NPDC004631]